MSKQFQHVNGFTYDADAHCVSCAVIRFGIDALDDGSARDSKGDEVSAIFPGDEWDDPVCCRDCFDEIDTTVINRPDETEGEDSEDE